MRFERQRISYLGKYVQQWESGFHKANPGHIFRIETAAEGKLLLLGFTGGGSVWLKVFHGLRHGFIAAAMNVC